jgi:hypothetical protein
MKNQTSFFQFRTCLVLLVALALFLPSLSMAFMDEQDIEKPKPEFTPKGDIVTAKFIPRAKSNSVTIDFTVTGGGKLVEVKNFDINKALRPEINKKDFRSDLFSMDINGVVSGGEATLAISSAFFSSSTSFWIFNESQPAPWMDSKAENNSLGEKVYQFVIRIKDGGQFDSDGAANGRITVIGGPSDSFWGYVVGTLFIRFFGVFIVLGVLMIGMLISGWIFQKMEKKPEEIQPAIAAVPMPPVYAAPPKVLDSEVTSEMAAAVGVALAMHLSSRKRSAPSGEAVHVSASWAVDGRQRIMSDRNMVFNRIKR